MSNTALLERMKDFFARYTQYCNDCLRDLESFPREVDESTLDAIEMCQKKHVQGREAFEKEHAALRKAWDAAPSTVSEREAVQREGQRAAEVTKLLIARTDAWREWIEGRRCDLTGAILGLQRGRAAVGKYATGQKPDAAYIDKKV